MAIDHDTPQVMQITGLSMAARAHFVTDAAAAERVVRLLMQRYPQQDVSLPMPDPVDIRIVCVKPEVISVLDYSKGFGHSDLVIC